MTPSRNKTWKRVSGLVNPFSPFPRDRGKRSRENKFEERAFGGGEGGGGGWEGRVYPPGRLDPHPELTTPETDPSSVLGTYVLQVRVKGETDHWSERRETRSQRDRRSSLRQIYGHSTSPSLNDTELGGTFLFRLYGK